MVVQVQGVLPAEQNPIVPTTRRRPRKRPPRSCRLVVDGAEDDHDQQQDQAALFGETADSPKKSKCDDDSEDREVALKHDLMNDNNNTLSSANVKRSPNPSPEAIVVAANPLDFSVRRSSDEEDCSRSPPLLYPRATPSPGKAPGDAPDAPLDLSRKPSHGNLISMSTSTTRTTPSSLSASSLSPCPRSSLPAAIALSSSAMGPLASLASKIEAAQWTPTPKSVSVAAAAAAAANRQHDWKPAKQPKLDAHGLKTRDSFRPSNRQNPWQSQWISRSGEQTKDVFTCVWCKEQFQSLADMTIHMKNSPRCGMAGMHAAAASSSSSSSSSASSAPLSSSAAVVAAAAQATAAAAAVAAAAAAANSPALSQQQQQQAANASSAKAHHNAPTPPRHPQHATTKDGVPLPRKLVRGQDVWLGKGAEQTRQILRCMWCGQSFKSLADMTQHMKVTQHYTNIISQEQIVSWKSPEEKQAAAAAAAAAQNQSQQANNNVMTCKVCDQTFGSLKDLSTHMVKYNHYKDHILRAFGDAAANAVTSSPQPATATTPPSKRNQGRGDRGKKSLPVRKLLELERQASSPEQALAAQLAMGRITCDECGDKVEPKDFVTHLKQCSRLFGGPLLGGTGRDAEDDDCESHRSVTPKSVDSSKELNDTHHSHHVSHHQSQQQQHHSHHHHHHGTSSSSSTGGGGSVLASLEKLVEKSFDGKGKRQQGSGILQRLGIDEEVYPPWHPAGSPRNFNSAISAAQMLKSPGSSEGLEHPSRGSTPSGIGRAQYGGNSSPDRQSSRSAPSPAAPGAHVRSSPAPSESSTRASSPGAPEHLAGGAASAGGGAVADDKRQIHSRSPGAESAASIHDEIKAPSPQKSSSKNKNKDNPLRELEKLLDKTETHRQSAVPSAGFAGLPGGAAGSILAFSWACGEGAAGSPEGSSIKCAFCDSQFVSKGAYRHHVTKMHFIKADNNSDTDKNSERGSVSPAPSQPPSVASDSASSANDSPHSKFLKYAELAKQLSSKYV